MEDEIANGRGRRKGEAESPKVKDNCKVGISEINKQKRNCFDSMMQNSGSTERSTDN